MGDPFGPRARGRVEAHEDELVAATARPDEVSGKHRAPFAGRS